MAPDLLFWFIEWISRINQELMTTPFWYTHGAWVLTLPSFLIPESLWAQAPGTDTFFLCHLADSRMEAESKGRRGKRITGLQNSILMSFCRECLLIGLSWYISLRNLAEMRKKANFKWFPKIISGHWLDTPTFKTDYCRFKAFVWLLTKGS